MKIFIILRSIIILIFCCGLNSLERREENKFSSKWLSLTEDGLDEVNDLKILQAVRESMNEFYHKKLNRKRIKRSIKKICYNELGCFEDSGPFSYLEMLPSHPEEINTNFLFYSAKRRSERPLFELQWLNMTSAFSHEKTKNSSKQDLQTFSKLSFTLDDLNDLKEIQTKVIVHGFGSACPHVWIYEMKTALMAVENCIVICVDWENGATLPNYVRAATNTRLVGKQLAMLLKNLKKYKGLDYSKTHIIGFSLGAHVAGFAGAELSGLNRITGLDPAGPLFESQHPKARLDNDDAEFVDIIHSNGETLILGGLGSWQQMGDVDFYPNGGRVQTGCSNLFVGAVSDFIWSQATEAEGRSLCNHRRAYKFFIDSVAPRCLFPAFSCTNYNDFLKGKCFPCDFLKSKNNITAKCGNMGYYANKSTARGQLYLITREEEPFCAHQFKLQIFNSFNDLPLRTVGKIEATLEGEGGLNETFLITEKEDTEFFAGQNISKIIVPHPALGFPTTLILNYKSYSGWLSKGLPHWDIDKVSLTDSFGRMLSMCKPLLSLKSGIPVSFNLKNGDCELPNYNEIFFEPSKLVSRELIDSLKANEKFGKSNNRNNVLNLGSNYIIKEIDDQNNKNLKAVNLELLPSSSEGTKSLVKTDKAHTKYQSSEIFEPILKLTTPYQKNTQENDFEIKEPILKRTSQKAVLKGSEIDSLQVDESKSYKVNKNTININIFPFKFVELFERAERYARETILPIISEQAPKFFGFGRETDRKPRNIIHNNFYPNENLNLLNDKKNAIKMKHSFHSKNTKGKKSTQLQQDLEVSNTKLTKFDLMHLDLQTYQPNILD